MYVKPTGPQGIGSVLDGSFRLLGSHFRRIWVLAVIGALAANAGSIYQLIELGPATAQPDPNALAIYGVMAIGGLLATMVIYGAMLIRLNKLATGAAIGGELGSALGRFGWLILLLICSMLVGAAAALPAGVYVATVWGNVGALQVVVVALLTAPVWLFTISLWFSQVYLFVERLGPLQSLSASHSLVWGKWWRTATTLAIGGVVVLVAYVIAGVAGGAAGAFLSSGDAVLATAITFTLVIAALSLFVGPYIVSLELVIYFDLKQRREGDDLLARAEAMS
jgi:hypothetical protein